MNNHYHCPVGETIRLIGGKYKALILWFLTEEPKRFGQLQKLIPEATPKMLTQQLRELEADALIIRTVYPVVPPKVEYTLSDLGKTMIPLLESMYQWGEDYLMDRGICPNCAMKKHQ
ncbi:MAG: helix-turn-helix transcriptional regulator [Clostridia bacterium]|nr:helix-turn-helix transcriptional regulator [Clostridia bacterium]